MQLQSQITNNLHITSVTSTESFSNFNTHHIISELSRITHMCGPNKIWPIRGNVGRVREGIREPTLLQIKQSLQSFIFYDRGGTCLWKKEPQLYSLIPTTKQKPYDNMYKSNQQYMPTYRYIHTCTKNCRDFLLLSCLSREQCNVSLYVYWSFGPRFTVYAYMFLTQLASKAEETGEENITSTFHYILL